MEVSKAEEAKTINHPKERQQTRKDQTEADSNHRRKQTLNIKIASLYKITKMT